MEKENQQIFTDTSPPVSDSVHIISPLTNLPQGASINDVHKIVVDPPPPSALTSFMGGPSQRVLKSDGISFNVCTSEQIQHKYQDRTGMA